MYASISAFERLIENGIGNSVHLAFPPPVLGNRVSGIHVNPAVNDLNAGIYRSWQKKALLCDLFYYEAVILQSYHMPDGVLLLAIHGNGLNKRIVLGAGIQSIFIV